MVRMRQEAAPYQEIMTRLGFKTGAEMASALGRSRKSASRWSKEGFPAEIQLKLLELAAERQINLSHKDFRNA